MWSRPCTPAIKKPTPSRPSETKEDDSLPNYIPPMIGPKLSANTQTQLSARRRKSAKSHSTHSDYQTVKVSGTAPFAPRQMNRLELAAQATTAAAATAQYFFPVNNLFDPTGTMGALQPGGYSQLASVYFGYQVHAAKLTIRCVNLGAIPVDVCMWPQLNNQAFPASFGLMCEQNFAKYFTVGAATSGTSIKTETLYITNKVMIGEDDNDQLTSQGTYSGATVPAALLTFQLHLQTVDASNLAVVIDFFFEFYNESTVLDPVIA